MSESGLVSRLAPIVGWALLLVGISVFLIRFQHAGPYGFPARGNLLAAVLALGIGAALAGPWLSRAAGSAVTAVTAILLAASPVVLFFALYATLAELEEVVVLHATDTNGDAAELRLWIVDYEGMPWVTMPRSKADAHGLDDARVELLRDGTRGCLIARRFEDREAVERAHRLRQEKYAIQRLATSVGLFGDGPGAETVTLRLEPCP